MKDIEKPASPAVVGRKRYSAPALTEYGSVARADDGEGRIVRRVRDEQEDHQLPVSPRVARPR